MAIDMTPTEREVGEKNFKEVTEHLGMNRREVERLLDFAERAGLASVDRASETLTMSITARSEEPSFDLGEPDPANLGLENQGVCSLPTTTLRPGSSSLGSDQKARRPTPDLRRPGRQRRR